MLVLVLILCSSHIMAEVTHTSDQLFLEKQPLVLLGKLPENETSRELVQSIINQIDETGQVPCYLVDCKEVSTSLCQSKSDTGLQFYSFSKSIRYVGRYQKQDMLTWANAVIHRVTPQLKTKQEIVDVVKQNGYSFVYFLSEDTKDSQTYTTLSRKYLTTSLYLVTDANLIQQLQMKPGNITMYKNQQLERQPFEHANSWERWQSFLATYSYPGINKLDSNQLTNDRFRQNTNVKFVAVFVDLSYRAQNNIDVFYKYSKNNNCGMELRLYLDYLRESQMMKIYYHIRPQTYPALVYVNLVNQTLTVSAKEGEFNHEDLQDFCSKAQNNELEPFYLSAEIPQNNGYTGKGVQKKIQKIVYNNFQQVVLKSKPTYVVMYTSVGQGCGNCEQSYAEFKKLSSYLQDEDIVFARYEFINNYVPQPIIVTIPQVVIYKQGSKDKPITQRYLTRFDEILKLIREHIPLENGEL